MFTRTGRASLALALGAGLALTATAATAAPRPAARPWFTITATDITYDQPDLFGRRQAIGTVTITNRTRATIAQPMVTLVDNRRDDLDIVDMSGCPRGLGRPDRFVCYTAPLQAGETRTLGFHWWTSARGPAGRSLVRVAAAADDEGAEVPGTVSRTSYRVRFAPLTGMFDINATDLRYGRPDSAGHRYGSTRVTIVNRTEAPIAFPVVTFPPYAGGGDLASWQACRSISRPQGRTVCVEEPLAPRQRRSVAFRFRSDLAPYEIVSQVQVEAGADAAGTTIRGTAAGARYTVWDEPAKN